MINQKINETDGLAAGHSPPRGEQALAVLQ
jgi:hypothetical protein